MALAVDASCVSYRSPSALPRMIVRTEVVLRSTGSTLVSQFLDSFVVVFIALYIGQQLPFVLVLAISIMNYMYKGLVALLMTPVIYWVHNAIDRYLGQELAEEMKRAAQGGRG